MNVRDIAVTAAVGGLLATPLSGCERKSDCRWAAETLCELEGMGYDDLVETDGEENAKEDSDWCVADIILRCGAPGF